MWMLVAQRPSDSAGGPSCECKSKNRSFLPGSLVYPRPMVGNLMKEKPTHRRASEAVAYRTDAARWDAVVRRDRRADGRFYYSVKTTGVYCRPSCAARLALRRNVVFH